MAKLFANSGHPDQMPHFYILRHLTLVCNAIYLLGILQAKMG